MLEGIASELVRALHLASMLASKWGDWPLWLLIPAAILIALSIIGMVDEFLDKRRQARKGDEA